MLRPPPVSPNIRSWLHRRGIAVDDPAATVRLHADCIAPHRSIADYARASNKLRHVDPPAHNDHNGNECRHHNDGFALGALPIAFLLHLSTVLDFRLAQRMQIFSSADRQASSPAFVDCTSRAPASPGMPTASELRSAETRAPQV